MKNTAAEPIQADEGGRDQRQAVVPERTACGGLISPPNAFIETLGITSERAVRAYLA
jgi:hypothetical protein